MKTLIAALIAIGVLHAVDVEYNDGRYAAVVSERS
jgi:hypothetical protein